PQLAADEIEASTVERDAKTGRPRFELKPIFLSPTSAVHERLTAQSLTMSNILNRPFRKTSDVNFIKGVYWNDSPERSLCLWCDTVEANVGALKWYNRFKEAQRLATAPDNPKFFSHGDPLFERSHYGDLAFIHGMAVKDGVSSGETRRKLMIWAEFSYKVAVGDIEAHAKIRDVGVDSFSEIFDERDIDVYDNNLINLFGDDDVRRNAMGSLLHLIQDSYSPAHAERENFDEAEGRFCRGKIVTFHAYRNQDMRKHSQADKWPANLSSEVLDAGARVCDPITAGAAILRFYAQNNFAGAKWD